MACSGLCIARPGDESETAVATAEAAGEGCRGDAAVAAAPGVIGVEGCTKPLTGERIAELTGEEGTPDL